MQIREVNEENSRTWALCNDEKVGEKYRSKFLREFCGSFVYKKGKWTWYKENGLDSLSEEKVVENKEEKPAKKRKKKSTFGFKKDIHSSEVKKTSYNEDRTTEKE
jgi:hypothetical protein